MCVGDRMLEIDPELCVQLPALVQIRSVEVLRKVRSKVKFNERYFSVVNTGNLTELGSNAVSTNKRMKYSCHTRSLTPRIRVFSEKLTGRQLVKKFPAFYRTRRFITAFARASHLSLS